MKTKLTSFFFLIIATSIFSQETYKTKYQIKTTIEFKCDKDDIVSNSNCKSDTKKLKRIKKVDYVDLSSPEKSKIKNQFKNIINTKTKELELEKKIGDQTFNIKYDLSEFLENPTDAELEKLIIEMTSNQKFDQELFFPQSTDTPNFTYGYAKLENNKLYINPWLQLNNDLQIEDREVYYFELENRQTVHLRFTEWSFSALVIPLKYRFQTKKNDVEISEEFSASVNANFFAGYTLWGGTYFHHREKVGNKENTWKITPGVFLGTSVAELNSSNTYNNERENKLTGNESLKKGLLSLGIGVGGSFNKLTANVLVGWDFAIGDKSQIWGYNGEPYLGFGIGYSLFKI